MGNLMSVRKKPFSQAILTAGVIKAITFAANNPTQAGIHSEAEYNHIMDVFQDHIPHTLIDPNQWWFCHYLSSGRTCNKCLEISALSQCDAPTLGQHLKAMSRNKTSGHDPSCSARNAHSFLGLRSLHFTA